ncbi:ABC transporter substrate-binding protein [Flavobacteriaceae bacterium 14752]|uniref:ABC transporter substrate-binding protein n=1 Tax=Mesohalobacter salilacus TaxID=2491711 RepID=UPI000F6364F7|nr:ABC transporter substrate-binding protein [Flavobacteriaceae bacterium 14752]
MHKSIITIILICFLGCKTDKTPDQSVDLSDWSAVEAQGQHQSINMMMWKGDPKINAYMNNHVLPKVKSKYGIGVNIVSGQGNMIVQSLMTELQANKSESEIDLVWINGETFYQLRQIDALYGPWTSVLPNAEFIDFENPFIGKDFQQDIDGYELPWGNVQMTWIYNQAKVKNPPRNKAELLNFVKTHPGQFTFDNHFTGLTFLKSLLISFAENPDELYGDFDEATYKKYSQQLWNYIEQLKPYLWQSGEVFPENVAQMHQLLASGEIWFSMSNNDSEVDNKISEGLFPKTARAYVPDFGSIQNSHYLGIPKLSQHKAAAMLVANFMISAQAQAHKSKPEVWGDGSVLDLKKLPKNEKQHFKNIAKRQYAPPRSELDQKALMELHPEYMIRLAEDFRTKIINP